MEPQGQAITAPVEVVLDRPRKIKFSMGVIRAAEAALGGFGGPLLLNALCTMLLFGLRGDDPKLTAAKLDTLVDAYLAGGGSLEELSEKVKEALRRSGVSWGKPKGEEDEEASGEARAEEAAG